jgi:hypothetical protein
MVVCQLYKLVPLERTLNTTEKGLFKEYGKQGKPQFRSMRYRYAQTANSISQCAVPNSSDHPFVTYSKLLDENKKMNAKTDIQVQQDVRAELKWQSWVNAADNGVQSKRSPSKSTSPCLGRARETIPIFRA